MQGQTKRSADGESSRSQTPEAKENRSSPSPSGGASSNPPAQADGEGEDSTSVTQNSIEAQDVLSTFIRKKENSAAEYLEIIEGMLNDWDAYGWAESTLSSIYGFIEEHGTITDAQKQAVENIKNSNAYGNRHRKSRRSRR